MTPLPRATCPTCGRSVPVRVNGALREHNRTAQHRERSYLVGQSDLCPASGTVMATKTGEAK